MNLLKAMNDLKKSIPCRDNELKAIIRLFNEKSTVKWPSVFIYGHTGTGKTLVVKSVMKKLCLPFVFINCVEIFSQRHLFESILTAVEKIPDISSSDFRCPNMNDFVLTLKELVRSFDQTLYIVLDKAERLRDLEFNILPAFLKLQELVDGNVCVVLISELIWEKYRTSSAFCDPILINFPNYNRDELIEILSLDCDMVYPKEFYTSYVRSVLAVYEPICRDLNELKYLCSSNFKIYCKPVKSGEIDVSQAGKLWMIFNSQLKKSLQNVYMREVTSSHCEKWKTQNLVSKQSQIQTQMLELPFYSKFLLIAAYLASYNPTSSDKRFFLKNNGKKKKSVRKFVKKEKFSNHVLGPKLFSLDRLLAIFYSIVEERVTPSALIFSQISSLVSIHLLSQLDTSDILQTPKYKCLVTLDSIRSIGKTVDFDVGRYLFDFI
uniref:Origin recognition complex subunit 5 n=1 Tax=Strigamia maritima TaxID=126957 RepID=T1JNA4_STRMM